MSNLCMVPHLTLFSVMALRSNGTPRHLKVVVLPLVPRAKRGPQGDPNWIAYRDANLIISAQASLAGFAAYHSSSTVPERPNSAGCPWRAVLSSLNC